MTTWKETTLDEIAEIVMGHSPKGETCNALGRGMPLLNGPTEFGIKHPVPVQYTTNPKRMSKVGDILFCVRGSTTGRMNWADQEYAVGRGIAAIRHKLDTSLNSYLRGLIEYHLPSLLSGADGSVFPNVTGSHLNDIEIVLPSLLEQKAIASILSSLDDKIDLLHRQNITLEGLAENLFRKWFIEDADPKWKKGKLGDMACNVKDGVSAKSLQDHEYYVGLEHMERKHLAIYNWGHAADVKSNKFLFSRHDILFGKLRAYFHKVCFSPIEGICSTDILVIRPKKPEYFSFCLLWFFNEDVVNYSDASSGGTRMPRTSWDILADYEIQIPEENLIKEFDKLIMPMATKMEQNIFSIRLLENMRNSLLPKLMNGEIKIKEISGII